LSKLISCVHLCLHNRSVFLSYQRVYHRRNWVHQVMHPLTHLCSLYHFSRPHSSWVLRKRPSASVSWKTNCQSRFSFYRYSFTTFDYSYVHFIMLLHPVVSLRLLRAFEIQYLKLLSQRLAMRERLAELSDVLLSPFACCSVIPICFHGLYI
jgi:hypothetical protein